LAPLEVLTNRAAEIPAPSASPEPASMLEISSPLSVSKM
jgi:hypothetical protein